MTESSVTINPPSKIQVNFTGFDATLLVLSLILFVLDQCSDIIVTVDYIYEGFNGWAITCFLLIFFPAVIVQLFSIMWLTKQEYCSVHYWLTRFCSLGLIHRFYCAIKLGLKSNHSGGDDSDKVHTAINDLSLLLIFASFLQSAPQLVFQLYITSTLHEIRLFTVLSAVGSILSLTAQLVTYSWAQRKYRRKTSFSCLAIFLQTLWRLGMLSARMAALVILLLVFQAWFLLFIGVHWAAMLIWIMYQKTDFREQSWEERWFNAVAAFIYCFCFFNLKEGRSRWRLISYFSLIVFQNLTCLTMFLMFYQENVSSLGVISFSTILGGTLIGTVNMLLYYKFFHPSGPIDVCPKESAVAIGRSSGERSLKNPTSNISQLRSISSPSKNSTESKLALSDSIVIVEETDMEDIRTLQKWMHAASLDSTKRHGITSPVVELYETASSVMSAHDYENLPAVNIAREGRIRTWPGYCDINTHAHDDSVGKDGHTIASSTTNSQDYLDSIADDYADCKTASSLHTILEETESNSSDVSRTVGACTLVATIDQIRTRTPMPDPERGTRVRRTFSLLRERFECREPPPPTAPWAPSPSPTRFVSVKDMRDFFLRQVLTPPKLAALRRKIVVSTVP